MANYKNTLVIQSHSLPLSPSWLVSCIDSVKDWSQQHRFDYQFLDDRLFELLPKAFMEQYAAQKVILTDYARLLWLQKYLAEGYQTVVWLDADFLIFNPDKFCLPESSYAVGREVWVQEDKKSQLRVYKKVHNAFLMFRQSNAFLDFYAETAEKLLRKNSGRVPPQFIGPKLLGALHNLVDLPVMETAGMLSPLVIKDLIAGGGAALNLFSQHSLVPITGANLSCSVAATEGLMRQDMEMLMTILTDTCDNPLLKSI